MKERLISWTHVSVYILSSAVNNYGALLIQEVCLVNRTWIYFSNYNFACVVQEGSAKPDVVILGAATVSCINEC